MFTCVKETQKCDDDTPWMFITFATKVLCFKPFVTHLDANFNEIFCLIFCYNGYLANGIFWWGDLLITSSGAVRLGHFIGSCEKNLSANFASSFQLFKLLKICMVALPTMNNNHWGVMRLWKCVFHNIIELLYKKY